MLCLLRLTRRVQEALVIAGLEGKHIDGVVETSGEGWSQGEKQLVRVLLLLLLLLPAFP